MQYSAVLYCIVLYSTVGGGWCSHEMVRGWAGDSQQLSPDTATLLQLAVSRPMSWPQVSLRSASGQPHRQTPLTWSPASSDPVLVFSLQIHSLIHSRRILEQQASLIFG